MSPGALVAGWALKGFQICRAKIKARPPEKSPKDTNPIANLPQESKMSV